MDVAETVTGQIRELISIGGYLRLPPAERPTRLRCAGTCNDGRPCAGRAFAKALESTAKAPHFAAIGHGAGCDAARTPSQAVPATLPGHGDRAVTSITLTSDAPRRRVRAAPRPARSRFAAHALTGGGLVPPNHQPRRYPLCAALRVLLGGGYPPGHQVSWASNRRMPADAFFVPLVDVEQPDDWPHGYWGRVDQAIRYGPTGAVHLQPRSGPRVVLPRATATVLGLTEPAALITMPGRYILAIGTVRTSRSGYLYVLAKDRDAFTHLEYT